MDINDQPCEIISFNQVEFENGVESPFKGDPNKEFGFILKQDGEKTIIHMSKEEMVTLVKNTINYLLDDYLLVKCEIIDGKSELVRQDSMEMKSTTDKQTFKES